MIFKKTLIIQVLLIFLSITINISAQEQTSEFKLLDYKTQHPIAGVHYEYNDVKGVTGDDGVVKISLVTNETMIMDHISYGIWSLSEAEILLSIEQGKYLRPVAMTSLFPVTVIAVRPSMVSSESINIGYQDKMAHDGGGLLQSNPVFSGIKKGGNYGFDPVLRGFKYDQINVVLNGAQCASAACPNRMDPPTSQMAPNMLDRVEILKGPHALRFGTGFGGTVNFVSAKPSYSDSTSWYGRLSGGHETNGNILRSEALIGVKGKRMDVGFFGAWSQGDDYVSGDQTNIQSDFQRASMGVNLGVKVTDNQSITINTTYNRARDTDFPSLPMDLREDDTWLFSIMHDVRLDAGKLKSVRSTVFGTLVNHLMDNLMKPLNPRMLNASTSATTTNYGGRSEGKWELDGGLLFMGVDFRNEEAEGLRTRAFLMGPNAGNSKEDNPWQHGQIQKTGLFAEYQISNNRIKYVFSGRLSINQATVLDPSPKFELVNEEVKSDQVNPSVSLGISLDATAETSISLWLGRAQRSASIAERYINYFTIGQDPYEIVGNPKLKPEVNHQADLVFKVNKENTKVEVDLFVSYMQDFISSSIDTSLTPLMPMSPGVRRVTNLEEAFKTGFEISWSQKLTRNVHHQLAVAYTYAKDLTREEPLPEIAPLDFRYSVLGNFANKKLSPEISFRHVLMQSRVAAEYGESVTPDFTLLNLGLVWRVNNKFRLSSSVNNILDENYYEHLSRSVRGTGQELYATGRSYVLSFNYQF